MRYRGLVLSTVCWLALAADAHDVPDPSDQVNIAALAAQSRESVVIITIKGRNGEPEGIGTGFVISPDGLIATNRHVIGEARPISVELDGGVFFRVVEVYATDPLIDLAIIRIHAEGLTPLPLGDSSKLTDGQSVIALGNPQGMTHSVVSGVVSAVREIDNLQMIQLAIPVEPGNSGGPVLDQEGKVQGIMTLKSAITRDLGFAIGINTLKPMLANPNPIPIERWLTIGAINAERWESAPAGHWRQRAGRILAVAQPQAINSRSLCVNKNDSPLMPYDVGVSVRLDQGNAGLVFGRRDDAYHMFTVGLGYVYLMRYGVAQPGLHEHMLDRRAPSYRVGAWNYLKARVEANRLRCWLNGELVFSVDDVVGAGQAGLIRFDAEPAEFRDFGVAAELPDVVPETATVERIRGMLDGVKLDHIPDDLLDSLAADARASGLVLDEMAWQLRTEIDRVRELAAAVNVRNVQQQLIDVLSHDEVDIDLIHAALLIALLDNPELRIDVYRQAVTDMATAIRRDLEEAADETARLERLTTWMFEENGFHGSRMDYYNRANSYLNEVIDDREGIPITLSVLFIELARRLDMNVVGVGMPGHFIVRHNPQSGKPQMLDVFNNAEPLDRTAAALMVMSITGMTLEDEHLEPSSKHDIIIRMLHNLLGNAKIEDDELRAARYLETIVAITNAK